MWRSLFRWVLRRPVTRDPGAETFGYAGAVRPIMIAFIVLSVVEIPIFDLIVSRLVPWPPARFIVLGLGVYGLLWMLGLLAMIAIHPHVVDGTGIRVRNGISVDVTIPWAGVAAARRRYRALPSSRAVQVDHDRDGPVVILGAGGQVNVELRLREPVPLALPRGLSEPTTRVRLYADDPDGFVAATGRHLASRPAPTGSQT
jgi:hypothetical protein